MARLFAGCFLLRKKRSVDVKEVDKVIDKKQREEIVAGEMMSLAEKEKRGG